MKAIFILWSKLNYVDLPCSKGIKEIVTNDMQPLYLRNKHMSFLWKTKVFPQSYTESMYSLTNRKKTGRYSVYYFSNCTSRG